MAFRDDPIRFGLQQLTQGVQRGFSQSDAFKILKLLQNQQKLEEKQKQTALKKNFYGPLGIPEEIAESEPRIQKAWEKEATRDKGIFESLRQYGQGERPNAPYKPDVLYDQNQQPIGVKIGKELIPLEALSQETQEQLIGAPQNSSSILSRLSNLGGGFLTQTLGLPGDIAATGIKIADYFGAGKMSPEDTERSIKKLEARVEATEPGTPQRAEAEQFLENFKKGNQGVIDILPTTKKIQSWIEKLTKGTSLEPFTVPQNPTDQWWHDMGGITRILMSGGVGALGKTKNLLKAAGVAIGGDAAGWLTEKATGNENYGNAVKNGAYLLYSIFPGLPGKMATASYNKFRDKVLNPAQEAGKTINMTKYTKQYQDIERRINKMVPTSEPYHYLANEAAKVEDLLTNKNVDPKALWENIKSMGQAKIPKTAQQAKGIHQELIDLQKTALKDFSNTISPKGGKLLEEANDLFKTSKLVQRDFNFIKQISNPRNYGAGAAFYLMGSYPAVIKGSLGVAASKFATRVLQSPAYRNAITQLAKASAARNTALVNKIIPQLDKAGDKILNQFSPQERAEIENALKGYQ